VGGSARGSSGGYSNNGEFLSSSLRRCTLREDGVKNSLSPVSKTQHLLGFLKCQIFKGNELQKIPELPDDKLLQIAAGLGNSYVV
jgi:hypothetical protein